MIHQPSPPAPATAPAAPAVERANLQQLVYRSEAVLPVAARDLEALLATSRRNNRRGAVTGLLLFVPDRYMQCLEGPPAAVRALFERIRADPRHRDVDVLLDEPVAARSFAQWDMACAVIGSSWWLDLARAGWASRLAHAEPVPSQGLMLMKSAWYEFGERFDGSPH